MKYYDPEFIKHYIDENKERIKSVDVGMREDWYWTAKTIFADGKYKKKLNQKRIKLGGVDGSYWATPVMLVVFKDGSTSIVECFLVDGKEMPAEKIAEMKAFAADAGTKTIEDFLRKKE